MLQLKILTVSGLAGLSLLPLKAQTVDWVFSIGSATTENIRYTDIDTAGNLYGFGYFAGGMETLAFSGSQEIYAHQMGVPVYFLVKYSPSGQLVWVKKAPFLASSMSVSSTGRIGLCGNFTGAADFDLGSGQSILSANSGDEIFFAQYDLDGDLIWAKQMLGDGTDVAGDVAFSPDGNMAVCGKRKTSTTLDTDPTGISSESKITYSSSARRFVAVYDSQGTFLWRKTTPEGYVTDQINDEQGQCTFDADGNLFHAYSTYTWTGSQWWECYRLNKMNPSGTYAWSKFMPTESYYERDRVIDLETDEDGNVYFLANIYFSVTIDDIPIGNSHHGAGAGFPEWENRSLLAKFTSNGQLEWVQKVGEMAEPNWGVQRIVATDLDVRSGTVIVGGVHIWNIDANSDPSGEFLLESNNDYFGEFGNEENYDMTDGFILALDYNGEFQTAFGYAGPGPHEWVNAITTVLDASGGVYICAGFDGEIDADPSGTQLFSSNSSLDILISRLDVYGTNSSTITQNCTGSPSQSEWGMHLNFEDVMDVATDECGNSYVVAWKQKRSTRSSSEYFAGGYDYETVMVKYNTEGEVQWTYVLPFSPTSIAVSSDGMIGLTGNFQGIRDFDLNSGTETIVSNSGNEIFIAKYDTDAELIWVKQCKGDMSDFAGDIAIGQNGNIVITGRRTSELLDLNPVGNGDTASQIWYTYGHTHRRFCAVYSGDGEFLWRKVMPVMTTSCADYGIGHSVFDSNGNLIVAHFSCEEYKLIKFSPTGTELWSKTMYCGSQNYKVWDLEVDEFGSVYFLARLIAGIQVEQGVVFNNDFLGGSSYEFWGYRTFIAKFNSLGDYQWGFRIGDWLTNQHPTNHISGTDLDVKNGTVVVGGQYLRDIDIDPDTNSVVVLPAFSNDTNSGPLNAFVIAYDYNGNLKQGLGFIGPDYVVNAQVALDEAGNVIVAGQFNMSVDVDPDSSSAQILTSNGGVNLFLTKRFIATPWNIDTTFQYQQICTGDSIFLAGSFRTTSGTYSSIDTTFETPTVLSTHLEVSDYLQTSSTVDICQGSVAYIHGWNRIAPGVYCDTFSSSYGCDSISCVTLNVHESPSHTEVVYITAGQSYFAGGAYQTEEGLYFDYYQTVNGCDSIVETLLWMTFFNTSLEFVTVCAGDSHLAGGLHQTASGTYYDTVMANGLLNVTITNLTVLDALPVTNESVSICSGESYYVGGQSQTSGGTYIDTLTSANGCDSVVQIQLTISAQANFSVDINIVDGALKASVPNGEYTWIHCNTGRTVETQGVYYFYPDSSGDYAVVADVNGCADTSQCIYYDPNASFKRGQVAVSGFPTQVEGQYFISFESLQSDIRLHLYDLQGRLVMSQTHMSGNRIELSTLPFAAGTYIVQVQTAEGYASLRFVRSAD